MKTLALDSIRLDGGTQPRVGLINELVDDYATTVDALPPIVVYYDGSDNWLADGFHRWHAHQHAGRDKIKCDVRQGDVHDARLFAAGCNDTHGHRRTNADKRKCVDMLLRDERWGNKSDRFVAEHAGVHHDLVTELRIQLAASASSKPNPSNSHNRESGRRQGKDGKWRKPKAAKPAGASSSGSAATSARMAPAPRSQVLLAAVDYAIAEACNTWPKDESRAPLIAVIEAQLSNVRNSEKEYQRRKPQ